jgi:hypothetical protein
MHVASREVRHAGDMTRFDEGNVRDIADWPSYQG